MGKPLCSLHKYVERAAYFPIQWVLNTTFEFPEKLCPFKYDYLVVLIRNILLRVAHFLAGKQETEN